MTETPPQKTKTSLNTIDLVAGTLAAVSGAAAASFLGVAGTVSGAALGSVIGTLGTALYTRSLHRGRQRLATLKPQLAALKTADAPAVTVDATGSAGAVPVPPVSATATVPMPGPGTGPAGPNGLTGPTGPDGLSGPPTGQNGAAGQGAVGALYGRPKRPRWRLAVASTLAAFLCAIAAITVAEMAMGQPLANLFGGHAPGTTTIGDLPRRARTTPAVTPAPVLTPTHGRTGGTGTPAATPTGTVAPATPAPRTDAGPTGNATPPATTAPTGTAAP